MCVCMGAVVDCSQGTEGISYVCRAGSSDSGTVHFNVPAGDSHIPGLGEWVGLTHSLGKGSRVDGRVQEALGFPVSSKPSDHMGYKDDFVGFLYVSPELHQG